VGGEKKKGYGSEKSREKTETKFNISAKEKTSQQKKKRRRDIRGRAFIILDLATRGRREGSQGGEKITNFRFMLNNFNVMQGGE